MRCYYTGEECDCGGELDTECPHEEMEHDDVLVEEDHPSECRCEECRFWGAVPDKQSCHIS